MLSLVLGREYKSRLPPAKNRLYVNVEVQQRCSVMWPTLTHRTGMCKACFTQPSSAPSRLVTAPASVSERYASDVSRCCFPSGKQSRNNGGHSVSKRKQ